MNDLAPSEWHRLFSTALNGTLTEAEKTKLAALLKSSAEARQLWFLYHDNECGLAELQPRAVVAAIHPPVNRVRWPSWRPLTAAAAGLVIGLFSASVVFAYAVPKRALAKSVVRQLLSEGFESGSTQPLAGLPRENGVWSGDDTRVVAAEAELKPKSGARMLRLVSPTFADENEKLNAWCDVYRLVDLRDQVQGGGSVTRLSAHFAATPFAVGEEYACRVEVCAFEDDLADAPQPLTLAWVRENCAADAKRKFPLKNDGVWQETTVEMPVTAQTCFLLVHLGVQRRVLHLRAEAVPFSGHYLDDVKLELITQPNPIP